MGENENTSQACTADNPAGGARVPTRGTFFDLVNVLLCVADSQGRFVEVNMRFEEALGLPRDELMGRPFLDLVHPEDQAETRAAFSQVATGGAVDGFENRYRHADGRWIWLSWNATGVDGTPYVCATARDVTQAKADAERLRSAEARAVAVETRLRAAVSTVADGIVVIDARGKITDFNPAAERIFGYQAAEVRGRNVSMLMPQPDRGRHDGYLQRYVDTGESKIIGVGREVEGLRRDGSRFPLELAISEMWVEGRRYFTGVTRDITLRREALDQLAAKTRELEEVAHYNQAENRVMAKLNRRGSQSELFGDVLTTLARELGMQPSCAYVRNTWDKGLRLAASHAAPKHLPHAVAPGEGVVGQVAEARHITELDTDQLGFELDTGLGKIKPAGILAVPMAYRETVHGVLVVASPRPMSDGDRSFIQRVAAQTAIALEGLLQFDEVVKLSEKLNERGREIERTNVELQRANRAKSEFLAAMSHELRTPLNAVIGFSEVLSDGRLGPLSDKQLDYIKEIFDSGHHLLSLINDILDLSKIEAGKMKLELAQVDGQQLLSGALSIVRERAAEKGVRVSSHVSPEIDFFIADGRKLRQVIYNLLSNAVKFTDAGGEVRLIARPSMMDGGMPGLEIRVVDTGIGIAKGDEERVFEPFAQLDGSLSRAHEGTGLGLTLVREMVELHGGTVTLESELGRGSEFIVRIPYSVEAPQSAEPSFRGRGGQAGSPVVLIVEDEDVAAEFLSAHLSSAGYQAIRARTADEGLRLLRTAGPDLVVLDILLPDRDGWDMLREMKADSRTTVIPVVVVSVVADEARGVALGAQEVFQKPVAPEVLVEAVSRVVGEPLAAGARVLVIDDDPRSVELAAHHLESEGYSVLRALGGREGIEIARRDRPDLIILDLVMPDVSGFDVVDALSEDDSQAPVPIIVLTSRDLSDGELKRLAGRVRTLMAKHDFDQAGFLREIRRAARATGGGLRP